MWVAAADVVALADDAPGADAALDVASRLRGVPYVWGGLSAYGIDCSGLVHLSWRRFGVMLPRDAADQAEATRSVPLGSERPGDLYFFARPGKPHPPRRHRHGPVRRPRGGCCTPVTHSDRWWRSRLSEARAATLVAAHRVAD